jgi:hypothetical protein
MRKIFSKLTLTLGASCALATAAFAGPLNTHGIPADAIGIFHADVEAIKKTESYTTALQNGIFERGANRFIPFREIAKIKKESGFDIWTDLHGVTLAFLAPSEKDAEGKTSTKSSFRRRPPAPQFFAIRGNFDQEKIRAFFEQQEKSHGRSLKTRTVGKYEFVDVGEGSGFLLFVDAKTLFAVKGNPFEASRTSGTAAAETTALLEAVVAALDGKAKSYTPPPSLTALAAQTGTPAVLFYLDVVPVPIPKPSYKIFPASINVAVGNDAGTLKFRTAADFESEEPVPHALTTLQEGLSFINIRLDEQKGRALKRETEGKPGKSAAQQLNVLVEISKISSALVVKGEGKTVALSVDYPDAGLAYLAKISGDFVKAKHKADAAAGTDE